VAISRKNCLFLGTNNGGTATSVLYGVLAIAKAKQVELFAYVRDRLVQLLGNSPPAATGLLTNAWLTAHPEARRCWLR
jgi:hypothetical protein